MDNEKNETAVSGQDDLNPDLAEKLRLRAAELGLSVPALIIPSIVMDGKGHHQGYSSRIDKFPTAQEEFDFRMSHVGKYWGYQETLEFIDSEGRYHISRDTPLNQKELKKAGYTWVSEWTRFTNGTVPSGEEREAFSKILHTPENEDERLAWAVRDCDWETFRDALAKGANIEQAEAYVYNPPLLAAAVGDDIRREKFEEMDRIVDYLLKTTKPGSGPRRGALRKALEAGSNWDEKASYSSHVLPRLLEAGENPFECHDDVPIFIDTKLDARAGEKLDCIEAAMLKKKSLSPKQVNLVKAQIQWLREAAAERDDRVVRALRSVWTLSRIAPDAEKTFMSKLAADLFEPLADSKRAQKFKQTLLVGIHHAETFMDLVGEFTNHVVLPQLVLDFHKKSGIPVSDQSISEMESGIKSLKWRHDGFSSSGHLASELRDIVRDVLIEGRSVDKIIGLSAAWHDQRVVFPDALAPIVARGEWHALDPQKVRVFPDHPEISIHNLTTSEELKREGKTMKHCVGGSAYTTKALAGNAHIFSVREGDEILSTIEVRWNGQALDIVQNRGPENKIPDERAQQAGEWLKQQFDTKQIQAGVKFGETAESKALNSRPSILRTIGFEVTQENINRAFEEYCHNKLRRGREYDPKTEKLDGISKRTELITGNYDSAYGGVAYRDLSANVWMEASGLRDKIWEASSLKRLYEKRAEEQRAREIEVQAQREERAWKDIGEQVRARSSRQKRPLGGLLASEKGGAGKHIKRFAKRFLGPKT
jgi:hypothetical protein